MVRNAMHTLTDRPSRRSPAVASFFPSATRPVRLNAYPNCAGVWTISYLIPSRSLKKSA